MPKLGIAPLRRQQLINAVIECIHKYGLHQTTFAKVGKIANTTPSIIAYYFGDKNGLLMATMRYILKTHQQNALDKIKLASSPIERIYAIIEANFDSLQVEPSIVSAWLAFWQQSRHDHNLQRLQKVNQQRLYKNLLITCRCFHQNDDDAKVSAEGIAALIDGMWVRSVLTQENDTRKQVQIIHQFLHARFNIKEI